MGIVTTNFIKGRMNKSIDERLLPPGEYIDALNVRLGSTETTEVGAVENSRGNEQLTTIKWNNVTFSTNAITIGALEDGIHETIYWFVHDPSNSAVGGGTLDAIISYNTISTGVTIHGDYAAVASTGNNALGKVYIYDFTDGTLITTLTDPETSGLSSFGGISDSVDSIDMNGTHLVVGVGYNDTGSLIRSGAIRIFN